MNLKILLAKLLTTLILLIIFFLGILAINAKLLFADETTKVKWDYQGIGNPQNWGQFASTCATGKQQSPININLINYQAEISVSFHYQSSALRILNNGRTVKVNCDRGSYIILDNQPYLVQQFHYHSPSEHSFNGQFFPAELHIVHSQSDRPNYKYTVVSIFLKEGRENQNYQPFIKNLPLQESPETNLGININLAKLLPHNLTTYSYKGSLTTPPCTEGVNWLLMTNPVELSSAQIKDLQAVFYGNNRPIQMNRSNE